MVLSTLLLRNTILATAIALATSTCHAIPITPPPTQFHAMTLHLSNHLLFDHIEPVVYQSSQYIATTLRTSLTLECNSDDEKQPWMYDPAIPVDLELLLTQLQGAVGSFLQDKLPGIWNRHLVHIDRASIQTRLLTTCTTLACLEHAFDQTERGWMTQELDTAWRAIVFDELPFLFQAAQNQVHGILALFDPTCQLFWDTNTLDRLMEYWNLMIQNRPIHSHAL